MKTTRSRFIGFAAVLTMFASALAFPKDQTLEQIAGYRQWTRVTPEILLSDKPLYPITPTG